MQTLAEVQARLNNIQSVKPILSALRTISLGRWQAAKKNYQAAERYQQRLLTLLPDIWSHLPPGSTKTHVPDSANAQPVVILALGSERGLCGHFNAVIVTKLKDHLATLGETAAATTAYILGQRLYRLCQQQNLPVQQFPFPQTNAALSHMAFTLTQAWQTEYDAAALSRVELLYNTYQGAGSYQPHVATLMPLSLPHIEDDLDSGSWPPPIIETDPARLYQQVKQQVTALQLYRALLEAAEAEHAARYQRMEAATQNIDRLIEELTISLQASHRQAITQEILTLVSGAGMLGPART
jgi:F-type H+-transporting ATPase subunit gamma